MSRKTVQWKRTLRQAGYVADTVIPRGAAGKARATFGREVSDYILQRAYGNSCCKPMSDEKAARMRKMATDLEKRDGMSASRGRR